MTFTLNIAFGGLCLFVQTPSALVVLMPVMDMGMEPHCPMLITWSENEPEDIDMLAPIGGQSLNLRGLAPAGNAVAMPKEFLPMSAIGKKEKVNPRWLTGSPTDCLATRIVLPLGSAIKAGMTKKLILPDGKVGNFCGRALVTVEAESAPPVTIFGRPLTPSNGEVAVQLLNIPYSNLDEKLRHHEKGESADHVQGYYFLLADRCDLMVKGPAILVGEDQDADKDLDGSAGCPTAPMQWKPWKKAPRGGMSNFFADPLNCTVGSGII